MLRFTRTVIFLMVLYQITYLQVMTAMCPVGGAMYYGPDYQMCFYVVIDSATSYSAKQAACARQGGVLGHVPDENANTFLISALSNISQNAIVLGINDIANEAIFRTSTGSVQLWIKWDNNQPDNCCGSEDCCVAYHHRNMVVNDRSCTFDSKTTAALCHLDNNPELPTNFFVSQNNGPRDAFTKLQLPSKGIVGAQLQNVLVYSRSMCAMLCRQDDNCHFFIFASTDAVCRTYAIPVIEPTIEGASLQTGEDNVWVRR